ncbi:hypothetical protein AMECASPLE_019643, partial [Ameca splendens]
KEIGSILQMASRRRFSDQEALEMLQKLDESYSRCERDSDDLWSVVSDNESESEPPPATKRRIVPSAGGGDVLFQGSKRLAYQQCHNHRRFRDRETSQAPSPQL